MSTETAGIFLDAEVADRITLINLTDYRGRLLQEVDDYYLKGAYLHPDDLVGNKIRIDALNLLIRDFGGE